MPLMDVGAVPLASRHVLRCFGSGAARLGCGGVTAALRRAARWCGGKEAKEPRLRGSRGAGKKKRMDGVGVRLAAPSSSIYMEAPAEPRRRLVGAW